MENVSKYLIDTNVILDVLLKRDSFYEDSYRVIEQCNNKSIKGYVSAKSICDIFYFLKKASNNTKKTYEAIGYILKIFYILPVNAMDIINASVMDWSDFEDCVLYLSAKSKKCDAIITRNIKHFNNLDIKVLEPKCLYE